MNKRDNFSAPNKRQEFEILAWELLLKENSCKKSFLKNGYKLINWIMVTKIILEKNVFKNVPSDKILDFTQFL